MITRDDVDLWREHPVTEAIQARLDQMEIDARAAWMTALGQPLDGVALERLRIEIAAKLEVLADYRTITAEDIVTDDEDQTETRRSVYRSGQQSNTRRG